MRDAWKNTLDLNYLALAEHHGAVVKALHRVEVIEPLPEGGCCVRFNRLDPDNPQADEPGSVEAGRVVRVCRHARRQRALAALPRLHKTLSNVSAALGNGFSGNGDFLLSGAEMKRDVDASSGPSITVGVDCPNPQAACIEDLGLPDPMLWFVEGMPANEDPAGNLVMWAEVLFAGRLRIAGATRRISHERERLLGGAGRAGSCRIRAMREDAADGRNQRPNPRSPKSTVP